MLTVEQIKCINEEGSWTGEQVQVAGLYWHGVHAMCDTPLEGCKFVI
jgi:hypothetical protein